MVVVVKLGGSVVTVKDEPETVDAAALDRVVRDVAGALEDGSVPSLVLVHGGGSFGHHHAAKHGVTTEVGTSDSSAIAAIHGGMRRLNDEVTSALREAGVDAVPVHPLSVAARDYEDELSLPTDAVRTLLAEGFVPVLHGDLISHEGNGATILSGDEIVTSLASSLDADRLGLCSTVPGVLDESGAVVPRIESYDDVSTVLGGSHSTDVTGGMAAKVRAVLDADVPASIFGPDDLATFLGGGAPGTEIRD